jgi:RNA polymerase sigma factor (sigma-70 family)
MTDARGEGAYPRASVSFTDRARSAERGSPILSCVGAVSAFRHSRLEGARGLSDERLVARVASGDDQAFEEIFDRYGSALLAFCVHMLGSREWGEDALQLTLVAAYKALRRGGCDGALRPWLYAIARNRCLSELRAPREIPDSDWVSAESPAIDGPASVVVRREELREIVEDVQRLPADQRAALVLFELGDQSHEEIATVLGIHREKVKALIFQAREGLHRARRARESACLEVREELANGRGKLPARGAVRAHIDRCAPCQEFAREVRRQRTALALVLPVALSGKLKALMLSSAVSQGGATGGAATGVGGAGSLSTASSVSSGSGAVAGPTSLASAAGSAGSASTAVGGGALSTAAGTAAPTMVASALGTDAVVTGGALTSSLSVATVAKLATVVAVAVGVGDVARIALAPSPRPHVSSLASQPKHAARLRSPLQPLASGIANPLASATRPGSQRGTGAVPATAGGGPSTPGALPRPGPTSAPRGSARGAGSATATGPSSGTSTTTPATTTSTASPPTTTSAGSSSGGSGSQGTSGGSSGGSGSQGKSGGSSGGSGSQGKSGGSSGGSGSQGTSGGSSGGSGSHRTSGGSSGGSGSQGTSGGSSSGSGSGPGGSTGHGQSSGEHPGPSVGHGPPIMPPGCVGNPAPGCAKKIPRS